MKTKYETILALMNDVLAGDLEKVPVLDDAIESGVEGAPKGVAVLAVMNAAWKRYGKEHPATRQEMAYAIVTAKRSIRLLGVRKTVNGPKAYDRTFAIGDAAEYDSFNLSYYGPIIAIGSSGSVTISKKYDRGNARLDLGRFSSRNRDFDASEAFERNSETSRYL